MVDFIPFVNTKFDVELLRRHYPDQKLCRVSLSSHRSAVEKLGCPIWIDSATDAFHHWPTPDNMTSLHRLLGEMQGSHELVKAAKGAKYDKDAIQAYVDEVLRECLKYKPDWISVPQLPLVQDGKRNYINRDLARATRNFVEEVEFEGRVVLPIVITSFRQFEKKTDRNKKIKTATECHELSSAHSVWIVDSSMLDYSGNLKLQKERFPGLIAFHEELREALAEPSMISGPYWGLNLVLWARGAIDIPAISLGSGFRYYLPGGRATSKPTEKIAIKELKRLAVNSPPLAGWMDESISKTPDANVHKEFASLRKELGKLNNKEFARHQVCGFYRGWIDSLLSVPSGGRALALFQQLSSAYVVGKSLGKMPKDEKSAARPERVAQQLMMNCL